MSLGNTYDNNKKNTVYDPSVYSPYKMNNSESAVDQTCLSFTFWNNSLKISISPKKNTTGNEGQVLFDYDNGISIYLSHHKARIFAEEIKKFISDPVKYDNSGVTSGQGLITVSRGVEFNSPAPLIIIRRIDENGTVMSSFAYQIKHQYYFAVRNYNENGEFAKDLETYSNLELLQIVTLLEEFYKATTCATAYTVIDQLKYEHNRQRGILNSIANKLGVEYGGGSNSGNGRRYNSTSYFNNAPGNGGNNYSGNGPSSTTGYTQTTLDDID